MAVRLSALLAGRALLPMKIPFTPFCQGLSKSQGLVRLEGLGTLKNFGDLIETRTVDPLAYSKTRS
jgi:hypothetical protein